MLQFHELAVVASFFSFQYWRWGRSDELTTLHLVTFLLTPSVALKSMATGSGKVWGAKLSSSPKVQRKNKIKMFYFPTIIYHYIPQGAKEEGQVQGGPAQGGQQTLDSEELSVFWELVCRFLVFWKIVCRSTQTNWKASLSLRDSRSGCRLLIFTGEKSRRRSLKTKTELSASSRSIDFLWIYIFLLEEQEMYLDIFIR